MTRNPFGQDPEAWRSLFFAKVPRYELVAPLGHGGMGLVFKVRDVDLNETIAMKVLWTAVGADRATMLTRFKSEISLNRKIKHTNVCRLYDFGMNGDLPYLTMEFVPGRSLGKVIEDEGRLTPAAGVAMLAQVARGVAAAHAVGIIHRDLKPANLMIRESGDLSILDFGLAHDMRDLKPRITELGTAVGTPHYMSPEQLDGDEADERSDIYAIGVIAYEALTGRILFDARSVLTLARQHRQAPVPLEPLEDAGVPPELVAIVLRCLRKEPAARFQTTGELAAQLEALRRILSPADAPAGPKQSRVRTAVKRRSRVLRGIAGAPPKKRPLVLIVDDEPAIRKLVATCLGGEGFDTLEAGTGAEALEILRGRPADLVLLDVLMPGLDGFDTVRVLKSQPGLAVTPVILMSGFPEKNRVAFAGQAGAVAFLAKPLRMAELVEIVRRVLGRPT